MASANNSGGTFRVEDNNMTNQTVQLLAKMGDNFKLLALEHSAKVENGFKHMNSNLQRISSELSGLKDAIKNITEEIKQLPSDVRSLQTTLAEIDNTVKRLTGKDRAQVVFGQSTSRGESNDFTQVNQESTTVNSTVHNALPLVARRRDTHANSTQNGRTYADNLEQCSLSPAGATAAVPTLTSLMEERMLEYFPFRVFSAEKKTTHPVVFIRGFEGVLPKTWTDKKKIRFIIGYIQGEAFLWATETAEKCTTFEQFEQAFLAKYWSPSIQYRLRIQVHNPEPYDSKKGTLRKYFERYINKTYFWDEPLSEKDVIMILKAKLPLDIREKLVLVPENDTQRFLSFLDELDDLLLSDSESNFCNAGGNGNNHCRGNGAPPQGGYVNQNRQQNSRNRSQRNKNRFNPGYNENQQNQW